MNGEGSTMMQTRSGRGGVIVSCSVGADEEVEAVDVEERGLLTERPAELK